jgi:hypothetical protein
MVRRGRDGSSRPSWASRPRSADLEDIAPPLSAQEAELQEPGEERDPYTIGREDERGTPHADRGATRTGRFDREAPPADVRASETTTRMPGGDR